MSGGERGQRGKETSSSKVGGAAASGAGSTMLHFIDVVKQYPGQEQVDLRVEIPCAISHNARIHAGHVYVAMLRAIRLRELDGAGRAAQASGVAFAACRLSACGLAHRRRLLEQLASELLQSGRHGA